MVVRVDENLEGGIRVPLIVKYPGFHKSLQDGAVVNAFATVMDILRESLSHIME
jgi:arylsulfatase A-like enzyme